MLTHGGSDNARTHVIGGHPLNHKLTRNHDRQGVDALRANAGWLARHFLAHADCVHGQQQRRQRLFRRIASP
jgi:hypothetical protein